MIAQPSLLMSLRVHPFSLELALLGQYLFVVHIVILLGGCVRKISGTPSITTRMRFMIYYEIKNRSASQNQYFLRLLNLLVLALIVLPAIARVSPATASSYTLLFTSDLRVFKGLR